MKNMKAPSTIETLRGWFSDFGLPKIVVTDHGSQFESEEFSQFMRENVIQHIDTPSYHQQSNGLSERGIVKFFFNSAILCPSISAVSQPKALHLSANGSIAMTS